MPFVQTLRCSCEKIKGQVDKWRYRCEVPLNKDTHRERGREREATAAVELLLVHTVLHIRVMMRGLEFT